MSNAHSLIRNNLNIPTIPEVVQRIETLVNDPDSGTREIGAVVAEDAPLAAKVLRIANSAFYGLSNECVSTEQATTVLGIKVLKNIVMQVAVMGQFDHLQGSSVFSVEDFWSHAIDTAHLCSFLAQRARGKVQLAPEEFYVCGLLHDIGKVVMLDGLGKPYLTLAERSVTERQPLHLLETRELGFNHTEVGTLVASRWGLPSAVADAIRYHHGPRENVAASPVVALVAHANLMMHRVREGNLAAASSVIDTATAQLVGLSSADVDAAVAFADSNRAAA